LHIIFKEVDILDIKIEKIIRTKRKTIALQITDEALLIVKAPFDVSDETIMGVVIKHKNWIERKKKNIRARDPKYSPKEFVSGEGFLFLGRYYKLNIVDEQDVPLKFENGFYLSRKVLSRAKDVFIEWYKKMAYEKILDRVLWYAQKKNITFNKINITNARKRWGSCSSQRNLNFSWRLIMAPLSVIDYVIVHEIIHLEEKNHSRLFWIKVKMLIPEYEKDKAWLKKNSYLLRL